MTGIPAAPSTIQTIYNGSCLLFCDDYVHPAVFHGSFQFNVTSFIAR